jgi:hypothetical protein
MSASITTQYQAIGQEFGSSALIVLYVSRFIVNTHPNGYGSFILDPIGVRQKDQGRSSTLENRLKWIVKHARDKKSRYQDHGYAILGWQ